MKFLRNNTFLKFVMSFVLLVCIIIGILGIFSYHSTKKMVLQRFAYQQQEFLNHLSVGVQDKIAVLNEVTLMVSMDSRVSKAYFYEKENKIENIQNYREIMDYLKGFSSSIDNLISISIHYKEPEVVVSQEGKFSTEMFYSRVVVYENMEVQDWNELFEEYSNFSLIHFGSVNVSGYKERTLTFGRTLPYDAMEHTYAIVAITVSEDFFNRMISTDTSKQNGSVTVVKNGKIVLTTEKQMSADMQEKLVNYSGENEIRFDGKKWLVSALKDDFNGWQYLYTIPVEEVTNSINSFKITIILLILLVLSLGLMLSVFFATRLYTPISKIVHNVRGFKNFEDEKETDDFELIHLGISNILSENGDLINKLETSKKVLRTKVISDIINGRKEIFDTKNEWLELGITFPFPNFQIIIIQNMINPREIDFVINDTLTFYRNEFKLYTVTKDSYYIMLCNYKADNETDTKVYEFAKKIEDTSSRTVVGVGRAYYCVEDVIQSYVEAMYALKYSGVSSGIVSAENVSQTEKIRNAYSIDAEQKLIWAVKTGDLPATNAILENFIELNSPIVYNALMLTAYKIEVSYSLIQSDEDYNNNIIFVSDEPEIVKKRIMHRYRILVEHFSKSVNEKYSEIFMKIKDKIDKSFTQEISLQQIGDELGYSVSYLSFIFKEVAKDNYLDYVNKLRVDYAKDLLLKTDLPIAEIAIKVGYNNTVTLNRVFKKIVGTTPGKYRGNNI